MCTFFGIVLRLQWFNLFTSNKNPALWREDFDEDSTLLCALDRIIDEAAIQTAGRELPQEKAGYSFYTTGKVKAVELLADRQK